MVLVRLSQRFGKRGAETKDGDPPGEERGTITGCEESNVRAACNWGPPGRRREVWGHNSQEFRRKRSAGRSGTRGRGGRGRR